MKVIVINNKKGGDGKSTLAKNLVKYLSLYGKTILFDSDEQANSTSCFVSEVDSVHHLANIFRKQPVTPISVTETIDLIAGSPDLKEVNAELYTKNNKEQIFLTWLKKNQLDNYYDYVVIDTHNDTGNITTNMFLAADIILGISSPSFDSLSGLLALDSYVADLKEDFINLETGQSLVKGKLYFIGNKIEHNTSSSKKFIEAISSYDNYLGHLEKREIFNEANNLRTTIFDLCREKKYQTASHRQFIERTTTFFDSIKQIIDAA
ncbi:TPA: ParA family protein [Streptococcus suis]|nr:ParA family protein [Streptococcus suis]